MVSCAARAGAIVWDHFNGNLTVERKADNSPVTAAGSKRLEAVILAGLAAAAPGGSGGE